MRRVLIIAATIVLAQNVWEYQSAPSSNSPQLSPSSHPPQSSEGNSSNPPPISSRGPNFPSPNMDRRIQKRFRISKLGRPRQQPDRHRLKLGMRRYGRSQLNRVMDLVAGSALHRTDKLDRHQAAA
jgi:hypothetical protein